MATIYNIILSMATLHIRDYLEITRDYYSLLEITRDYGGSLRLLEVTGDYSRLL